MRIVKNVTVPITKAERDIIDRIRLRLQEMGEDILHSTVHHLIFSRGLAEVDCDIHTRWSEFRRKQRERTCPACGQTKPECCQ